MTMQLGVCYYPEHWPEAWWAQDAQQMVEMGIRKVRIGEFCWSRIEPRPDEFDWTWLDLAIKTLANAGLQIVLCTPTATPPKWLVDGDPDMLAVGADGHTRRFGSRRHYDFSSDTYLAQSRRITLAFAKRYGRHSAVVAWQTDNEYGCHDTVVSYSPQAVARFRLWLRTRYGSINALNDAWGNVFWSQEYSSFEQIDSPLATVTEANPAHRLDYRRFASDEVVRFNQAQVEILREHAPGRTVVHNFMQLFTGFDHYDVAKDLDVAAWDSYPLGALEMFWFSDSDKARWRCTGHPDFAAFHHDLYRGMSRQPFWVMEQQPGAVNWATWNPAPAPGMVRLWTWEAFAHGADVVSYFRWRQAPMGQEQMHEGLQLPNRQRGPGGDEAAWVARELPGIPVVKPQRAHVALVFDYPSRWLLEVQPQGGDYDGLRLAFECYSALRSLGLDIDIVPSHADLKPYALIVLPAQPLVPAHLERSLLASRAQVVLYPRTGSKVDAVRIAPDLPPGCLAALVDVWVSRVESMRPGAQEALQFEAISGVATRWRETLWVGPLATVEATFSDGSAAIARQNTVRYLGGWFDTKLQRAVLCRAALEAGLAPVGATAGSPGELGSWLPEGLRIRRRGDLLFAFNYSDTELTLNVPQARWLLGSPTVPAYGVCIAQHQPVI
jgi:beta-galactosidase